MKNTVLIVYNGGAYGSYLKWVLQFLITSDKITFDPFSASGDSHKGFDPQECSAVQLSLSGPEDWRTYLESDLDFRVASIHPKIKKNDSVKQNIEWFADTTKSVIVLYPSPEVKTLCLNNWVDKVKQDWWDWQVSTGKINLSKISQRWNLPPLTNHTHIPRWIKREFLSYYLLPAWEDQVEWYLPDRIDINRCLLISVSDLLSNFPSVIENIRLFCGLDYQKKPIELLPFHHKMLSLQKNLGQDLLCNQIIHCTLDDKNLDWTDQYLSLTTESLIQYELRQQGFEMYCDGLDKFPTNSVELKKIIYRT